ncbi:MAG TPA: hypothetical protein VF135_09505 [Terriglobales bacterium]
MRNLIQTSLEELETPAPAECATCNQLRQLLKQALMNALLASTWTHLYGETEAQTRLRAAEVTLRYSLKDLREHRMYPHRTEHSEQEWAAVARPAS